MKVAVKNKMIVSPKTFFLSILGLAYYFLIAIFLFRVDLVDKVESPLLLDLDFYFIVFISILLSCSWFLMNYFLTHFLLIYKLQNKRKSEPDLFISTMICSIGYLSCALLINYILDYDFGHFIAYAFLFLAIRIIWAVFSSAFFKK